ncbi:uncharacterized protein LOC127247014 [Andrographis paniculata]|uniref:uncharacterized protein LOC127247014 n=1 Tax=Andrographis paniculata TaxID=175694 RepID=UPI0021E94DFE|nr:uncharacterized protein LOC127247014 [Andrographis paniculata]
MASLQSIHFLAPSIYYNTHFQRSEIDAGRCDGVRLMKVVATVTGHLPHEHSGGMMILSSRWCIARKCYAPMWRHFDARSSGELLISGFWVGPDVDDGWGYVEASVSVCWIF